MQDKNYYIKIRGARVHNLKDIDLDIPKGKLVVITGLSGSGKSSLAFDTIYAEAERRFVESLSSYARQFLGVKEKPDVESITGLSPAIAIDQKSVAKNPRSTVGTITEIYDYLRILFARAGMPHCPKCKKAVSKQSADEILKQILKLKNGTAITILAPVVKGKKGEHRNIFEEIKRGGFLRVRVDGEMMRFEELKEKALDPKKIHSIEVVVDRLLMDKDLDRPRLRESLETALKVGKGIILINETLYSEFFACADCGISMPEIEPRLFSFNSPYGACSHCTGLGSTMEVDPELVIPNKKLTLAEGAIKPWAAASHSAESGSALDGKVGRQSWYWWILSDLAERYKFSLNTPYGKLPEKIKKIVLSGDEDKFEGVVENLKRRWKETKSEWTREELEKYMKIEKCPSCAGQRLRPEALAVTYHNKNIADVCGMTIEETKEFFAQRGKTPGVESPKTPGVEERGAFRPLLKEITRRLEFLLEVGLDYLTLERESTTLAGGEAQRVRLATQIGSSLTGVIYVLDEPSIGLHPRDHARLIKTLKDLRGLGNTVLVVEHDIETMKEADWIIDMGPGAGKHGGKVIFEGTFKKLLKAKTLTGDYLSGRKEVRVTAQAQVLQSEQFSKSDPRSKIRMRVGAPEERVKRENLRTRGAKNGELKILGASEHNLKNIDVKIPLGKLVAVSGVSGSGKSSLIDDILAKALSKYFYGAKTEPGEYKKIEGLEHIDKAILVDQSPIGRTPRSNPATYTGVFTQVREIFARTVEARARGYKSGRFSFNVKGGRCEICEGQGVKKIEMYFLPDIYVECEECKGKRYNREALEILYQNKTIAGVLDLSIEEAHQFFKDIPQIADRLKTLVDVGLGYMKLGQPATTLSGGEAQRVKLAFELSKKATGRTLYILDEPTTGLHFDDIQKLLNILRALVDKGNSVLIIEHNIDVLKNADWIIDLGPEGGIGGGRIVAEGIPGDIADTKGSFTGQWLRRAI
ncbi:excinuclease ABC subunit A [Candidatus Giovannonibacteria bacterium RIFCSPHIGHO2_02_43_13]|uniref:UvrABC system protein A n=1 Tax=Candidatus Giovannonibacteria bacterium RIFCSPHIGHO2_02_43_13 TaxID=1798330 RepID=A0A1F5WSJ0_9BACT|nr:MAG: excinuclease ABC subunit A [Candidatus Giovannonibacteria bacterium RIFCSPHIGHO2_12_FULL_44_42]OGF78603.1 MAG: excinuclease ABC subunit A [Candidatus Giovannonibacteria bacterium RIFCSPHIGHO2_02_43_13]OGF89136.1 MAG: excinuclease ABC subunit A [Candidatus Giovannonibacteria bacterium RIFCSPLOWO2_02_FULL_43_54]OGF96931.1 MAG: excinuclease ABC subunit A [Candidatus Giovannonibacteria bacterium RIFCSPLOWO2_12_FULL_44_32]